MEQSEKIVNDLLASIGKKEEALSSQIGTGKNVIVEEVEKTQEKFELDPEEKIDFLISSCGQGIISSDERIKQLKELFEQNDEFVPFVEKQVTELILKVSNQLSGTSGDMDKVRKLSTKYEDLKKIKDEFFA